jgi:hypothetical protein
MPDTPVKDKNEQTSNEEYLRMTRGVRRGVNFVAQKNVKNVLTDLQFSTTLVTQLLDYAIV